MALFKFRKGRDEQPAPAPKAPTVEAVRRRAMHRLIGAAVLVLAGVIGFPLIFDNQPRPISVDLPIEIVDKSKARALVLPSAPPASGVVVAVPGAPVEPLAAAPPATVVAPADTVTSASPTPKTPAATDEKPEVRSLDAKKARALLEARPLPTEVAAAPAKAPAAAAAKPAAAASAKAAASDDRFVVQIGAFADASKVRDVRRKVEEAGLKTYTQVVSTSEGDRTRVRVGPFADRADADKAAEKIRQLKLAAAILAL